MFGKDFNLADFTKEFSDNADRFVRVSEDEQLKDPAFSAIIANARSLVSDAKALLAKGSLKSAMALAVLSFEESGKATLVRWRKFGLVLRDIKKELSFHRNKQLLFQSYILATGLIVAIDDGLSVPKTHIDVLKLFLIAIFNDEGAAIKQMVFNKGNIYNSAKEQAFYIDIDDNLYLVPQEGDSEEIASLLIENADKAIEMASGSNRSHVVAYYIEELNRLSGMRKTWKNGDEMATDVAKFTTLFEKLGLKPNE